MEVMKWALTILCGLSIIVAAALIAFTIQDYVTDRYHFVDHERLVGAPILILLFVGIIWSVWQ